MRRSRWLRVMAIAGLAWLSAFGLGLGQNDGTAVREAAERLFARSDIQFELPGWDDADEAPDRPLEGDWRVEERDIAEHRTWRLDFTGGLPPFWRLLVWTVAICCVLLLVYWLVDSWAGFTRPNTDGKRETSPEAGSARSLDRAERVLDEAERLAAEGRFADAVHALLLHGLGILRGRLGTKVAAALTSREILALSDLPAAGHETLSDLVARVELTYFGERTATAEDYLICRGLFEDFAQAMRTGR